MAKTTLTIGEDELNEIFVDEVGLTVDELRERGVEIEPPWEMTVTVGDDSESGGNEDE
jgi:hypothetical protein